MCDIWKIWIDRHDEDNSIQFRHGSSTTDSGSCSYMISALNNWTLTCISGGVY